MADRRFTFFESYREVAKLMTDEERLAFYDALIGYAIGGDEPEHLEGAPLVAFTMARPSLDKSARRAKANSRNANKRWETGSESEPVPTECERDANGCEPDATECERDASECEQMPMQLFASDSHKVASPDIDKDIDVDIDRDEDKDKRGRGGAKRPSRPRRPSPDEWWERWQQVCEERGVPPNRYEADSAFSFYDANGWRQNNGNPIRSWKGALWTCFLRAHPELKKRQEARSPDVFSGYD